MKHTLGALSRPLQNIRLGQTQDAPALFMQIRILATVATLNVVPAMPVDTVALHNELRILKREVGSVSPELSLLHEVQSGISEHHRHNDFDTATGLSQGPSAEDVSTLAGTGAEAGYQRRLHLARLAADLAVHDDLGLPEWMILAHDSFCGMAFRALDRAVLYAIDVRCSPRNELAAVGAWLGDRSPVAGPSAFPRTYQAFLIRPSGKKRLAAVLADTLAWIRIGVRHADLLIRSVGRRDPGGTTRAGSFRYPDYTKFPVVSGRIAV